MAKRARGASGRPGRRRPVQRTGSRPASAPIARPAASEPTSPFAGEVAAQLADRPVRPPRFRTRTASVAFAESAAVEYAYVTADVRRIGLVAGVLFGILILLFVLIDVIKVIHL